MGLVVYFAYSRKRVAV
ncbi:MAG: hypothetical protein ACLQMS_03440 [Desulfomonilaceae bacterium]